MSLPDTFTGTDGTALSTYDATWVRKATWNGSSGGYVKILSNAAVFDTGSGPAVYYYNSAPSSADYETSVDITITGDIQIGVAMRISSSGENAYFAYIPGKAYNVRLYKVVSGSQSQIGTSSGTVTWTNGSTHNLKIKCTGTSIEVYWDGTLMLTVTDSSISAAGFPGLYIPTASGASYDNFTATGYSGTTITVTGTTALPAFSGSAQVAPVTSITVTTALPAFSGGASMASASATVTATTSLPSYSGGATGDTSSGTLTLPVLKNNTGTVLANETGATVHVYAVSTGNKVVTKTGQTTNASGVMTVTDALIVGGTQYRVVVVLGSGAEGLDKVTAS